jgi:hypothetical protein
VCGVCRVLSACAVSKRCCCRCRSFLLSPQIAAKVGDARSSFPAEGQLAQLLRQHRHYRARGERQAQQLPRRRYRTVPCPSFTRTYGQPHCVVHSLSCRVVSCRVVSCRVVSCRVWM